MTPEGPRGWLDGLAAAVTRVPEELRALASDELHIGGFTNVQLEHPVLDLRTVAEPELAERALVFFIAGALARGATLARVHVARGPLGSELAKRTRREFRAAVERVDDESLSLLRYFDVYLRAADAIGDDAGEHIVRRVTKTLSSPAPKR